MKDLDFSNLFSDKGIEETQRENVSNLILEGINPLKEHIDFASGRGDFMEWIEKNRIIYGHPFSYSNADPLPMFSKVDLENLGSQIIKKSNVLKLSHAKRPYITQYVNDLTPDKSVIKCRQSELSETEINDNIFCAATKPYYKVRHIFPTAGMANQMAREKISPGILKSPRIKKLVMKPYNLTSKEFEGGGIYSVDGSYTDHGGRGPSSDKITFDEYETQNPMIEEVYSESLSHSAEPKKVRISTPLLPNAGIDLMFGKGCQYEWFTKCPKCGLEQIMEFPDNIIGYFEARKDELESEKYSKRMDKVYIGCRKCAAYFDRNSEFYLNNSRWISKRPHLQDVRASYRITAFQLGWKTGREILFKYHSFMFVHQFWNEVAGYAYVDPSAVIDREIFNKSVDSNFKNSCVGIKGVRNVSIGVDWGGSSGSWVVVRASGFAPNKKNSKIIYIEKICRDTLIANGYRGDYTDHVERLTEIIKIFRPKIIVNDANGIGADRNETLIKRFPSRAYGCFYDTDEIQKQKKKQTLLIPQWNDGGHKVTVSRLYSFKSLIREYEEGRVTIPQLDPNVEEFIKHHTCLVFQNMVDDKGRVYEIVGHTGPDHLGHADNYSKIGFEKLVNNEVEGGNSAGHISGQSQKKKKSVYEKKKEEARKVSSNPDL